MLFNSLHFALFFPIVTLGYFLLPPRLRWIWLLAASCYFYMAFVPLYLLILVFTIVVDYVAGLMIEGAQGRQRKVFLIASLIANIGVLSVFKYFNFFNDNLAHLARLLDWNYSISNLALILPIGLSFHTFQSMAYTIEVYRGNFKAERHFGIFALYVMFYPQLVAGPIERPQNLLPQLRATWTFDYVRIVDGLQLMAWGFFKKVVIADRLAVAVNAVYDKPWLYSGFPLLLATWFFAIQIFCDFSGYSDIAIGAAQVMGHKLMTNFRQPYFADSVTEFWKRWHISLSTWFRDYLYIPLGGNRKGAAREYFNVLVVFLLSGLWHGANWTFVIWGALNGLFIAAERFAGPAAESGRWHKIVRIFFTFNLISLGWVFFRAKNVTEAFYILRNILPGFIGPDLLNLMRHVGWSRVLLGCALIFFLEAIHLLQRRTGIRRELRARPALVRWAVYCCGVMSLLMLGDFASAQQFIYFQF